MIREVERLWGLGPGGWWTMQDRDQAESLLGWWWAHTGQDIEPARAPAPKQPIRRTGRAARPPTRQRGR